MIPWVIEHDHWTKTFEIDGFSDLFEELSDPSLYPHPYKVIIHSNQNSNNPGRIEKIEVVKDVRDVKDYIQGIYGEYDIRNLKVD